MEYTTEIINISKIKEGFFVGDQIAGTTPEVIVQFKITHIINAAGSQIVNQFERIKIKYLTLNWAENQNQNLFDSKDEIANRIVSFIDESFKKGEGLLAHSVRGQDRVCIVVIIYLMKKYNWALIKCLDFLSSKKQDVDIPKYFLAQLTLFETRLGINRNPQNNNKNYTWDDTQIKDDEEMLMRNTYINGLNIIDIEKASNIKKSLLNPNKKKNIRVKVGWADDRTYGRSGCLITENPQRDLITQRNIMPVTSHIRLRPSKSCFKNRSNSTGTIENNNHYSSLLRSVKGGEMNNQQNLNQNSSNINNIRVNSMSKSINPNLDKTREMIENINNVNNNTLERFTFGLDNNLKNQINNYMNMNKNQKMNMNMQNNQGVGIMNFKSTTQQQYETDPKKPPKQYISNPVGSSMKQPKQSQSNTTNNYNRNINNNNRMNNFFKDNNNLNKQQMNNNQNNITPHKSPIYDKNRSNSNTNHSHNQINYENFINAPNNINNVNYRNYSLNKEPNTSIKNNKIILANNYEEIITNNINNYYIQNQEYNSNKYPNKGVISNNNFKMINSSSDKQLSMSNSADKISVNLSQKRQINNYIRNENSQNFLTGNNSQKIITSVNTFKNFNINSNEMTKQNEYAFNISYMIYFI